MDGRCNVSSAMMSARRDGEAATAASRMQANETTRACRRLDEAGGLEEGCGARAKEMSTCLHAATSN
jgi:hypothetical protein